MKVLGLIGGISWVSTIDYYKYINQMVNEKLGGNHFAKCIIYSLNYGEVMAKSKANDNDGILKMVTDACMHPHRRSDEKFRGRSHPALCQHHAPDL